MAQPKQLRSCRGVDACASVLRSLAPLPAGARPDQQREECCRSRLHLLESYPENPRAEVCAKIFTSPYAFELYKKKAITSQVFTILQHNLAIELIAPFKLA